MAIFTKETLLTTYAYIYLVMEKHGLLGEQKDDSNHVAALKFGGTDAENTGCNHGNVERQDKVCNCAGTISGTELLKGLGDPDVDNFILAAGIGKSALKSLKEKLVVEMSVEEKKEEEVEVEP